MNRIHILFLSIYCLLITFVCSAQDNHTVVYPENILFKKYGVQFKALDSIRSILYEHDYAVAVSEYKDLEKWAGDKGDIQLKFAFRLNQYAMNLVKGKQDDSFEKSLIDLINDLDENKLNYLKAVGLELLADYYWKIKNYALSLENYLYAYDIYTGFSVDEFPQKPEFLYDLGGRYYHFRDFKTAKQYYLEVWQNIPFEKVENGISKMNTLALSYSSLDMIDSSNYYFHKAQDYAIKTNNEIWIGIISGNLGNNYFKQKKYDESIPLMEKNIEISTKHHVMTDLAISLSEYGEILLVKKENKKALEMQLKALDIIKEKNLYDKYFITYRIYPNVAKAYAANGNTSMAYAYSDSAYNAKDSLEKERNSIFVTGVQHKIDIEKHKAELLKNEAELRQQKIYRNTFIIGFAIVMLFSIGFFVQKNKIGKAKKLSDKLLLNILPADVAEELKSTGKTEARDYEFATVMFTDFKDFTKISEQMSPSKLVEDIDFCFSAFDNIIHKYGIEKIKTIGDAYMCAGGLPVKNYTHAEDTVRAALEIRDFMNRHNKEKLDKGEPAFEIRIGINTGPVVAGIVGVKKFAYDIWGDTVNLAARMESGGREGEVNISGSTYELIKDKFTCTHRGKIQTKNKGEVDMYFVS